MGHEASLGVPPHCLKRENSHRISQKALRDPSMTSWGYVVPTMPFATSASYSSRRVAEQIEVDLLVLLAEARRRQPDVVGRAFHLEQVARIPMRPEGRRRDLFEPFALAELLIGQRLDLVVDRGGGDAGGLQRVEEALLVAPAREASDLGVERRAVRKAVERGREALVLGQRGLAEDAAQRRELLVGRDVDGDPLVVAERRVDVVRRVVRCRCPEAVVTACSW